MSEEEINDPEALKKEIAFFKSQTKVLREKNRDLRNALLLAEAQGTPVAQEETAQESLSDIRKIIADSKQQITEKLSKFKETMDDSEIADTKVEAPVVAPVAEAKVTSADDDVLLNQIEYMKKEIDRLENFLEQSEMVNDRLRMLLTEHNIDVSEISKAISQASKTAIKETPIAEPTSKPEVEKSEIVPEPVIKDAPIAVTPEPKAEVTTQETPKKTLDPAVAKLFDNFKTQIDTFTDEKITMEILEIREELMDLIPHTRVFYEMQIEYRKWKKGTSSKSNLKKEIAKWEETIAEM